MEKIIGRAWMTLRHPASETCPRSGQTVHRCVEVTEKDSGEGIFRNQRCTESAGRLSRYHAPYERKHACNAHLEGVEYRYHGRGE